MIFLSIPGLPPSTNHAYVNNGFGGRTLSAAGKRYKLETTTYLARVYREDLKFFVKDAPYLLALTLYFPDLECKTWPSIAKTRYKKLDAGNRLKLFEDALVDATGIDDSQHIIVVLHKKQGDERTEARIWRLDMEGTPFNAALGLGSVQPYRALPGV